MRLLRPAALRRRAGPRLGDVGLVICLDSGAGNYDQLWLTTVAARHGQRRAEGRGPHRRRALRRRQRAGAVELSHHAAGARPAGGQQDRPPAARRASTARCRPSGWRRRGPRPRSWATRSTSAFPGPAAPTASPALPTTTDPVQALINRTWRPTLSVTGAEGFPALQDAGNVLRPYTAFKLSLRLPPLVDGDEAVQELKTLLEDNAPYQAKVTFEGRAARRRHRLERARPRAVVRARAERRVAGAFRRAVRLHRPGRHDPADEHAAAAASRRRR